MPMIHVKETEYAPPVIRAPSPASSIGTTYAEDQTSEADRLLSQTDFDKKCWTTIFGEEIQQGDVCFPGPGPLIQRPEKSSQQEDVLFKQVMGSLRRRVRELEEDELFETFRKGSLIGQVPQPSTTDIDALMRSMMIVPASSATAALDAGNDRHAATGVTNGTSVPPEHDAPSVEPAPKATAKRGKRSRSSRTRKT